MRHLPLRAIYIFAFVAIAANLHAQQPHRYFVSFFARNASLRPFSIGGHAFVAWGSSGNDSVMVSDKILGFFPGENSTILSSVAEKRRGRIVRGFRANSKDLYLRHLSVEVDSATWYDTQCLGDIWNYQPYNLFSHNCVDFLNELAGLCRLKQPSTRTWVLHFPKKPYRYLRGLQRKNKKRAVHISRMVFD